jgi:osmotically-inducible protein OsmY
MKTFFVALILGIFIGSMITAYYNSPEAFESLLPNFSDSTKNESTGIKENQAKPEAPQKSESEKPSDEDEELTYKEKASAGAKAIAEKSKDIIDSTKDLGIGTAIRGKFKLDKSIDPTHIKIEVTNGSVVLLGSVSSRAEERKARDIALDTRGVKDVSSKLTIEPSP